MIIYGTRSTHLKSKASVIQCPTCSKKNNFVLSAYRKYFHLFWIPFIPLKKIVVGQCKHCKLALDEKHLPQSGKYEADQLKDEAKTPLWKFSLLILLGLGLGMQIITFIFVAITR